MVPIGMFMKALLAGGSASPLYVVFFVTEKCAANCAHCLLGRWTPQENELSLDEIERWARKMPDFYFLLPTGGEPFLRDDLPQIVEIFSRNCAIRNAGIPTNGSMPDKTVEAVQRILSENRNLDFAVDVSFDGIGADHDRIRGLPGLFDNAVETFTRLGKIAENNPRFNLNVAFTLSSLNKQNAKEIIGWVVRDLGARNINHLLVRGAPRDPASLDVDASSYHEVNRLLEKYMLDGSLRGYSGYDAADGINAIKLVRQDAIEKTLRSGRAQCSCRAGTLGAVVRASGEVFPCELLDSSLGGLRDSDFDFMKIWHGKTAEDTRRKISATGCFCTYECFMTLNVLFDPALAAKVASRWISIKASYPGKGTGKAHV